MEWSLNVSKGHVLHVGAIGLMNQTFQIKPIAIIHSAFQQKFGVPRQSGLVATKAVIQFIAPYDSVEAFNGLDKISHIWLTFVFHKHLEETFLHLSMQSYKKI